jgi:hypothetical protein
MRLNDAIAKELSRDDGAEEETGGSDTEVDEEVRVRRIMKLNSR